MCTTNHHCIIATKEQSLFHGCLLASCTWIDLLVRGLTPHIGGSNYLHMIWWCYNLETTFAHYSRRGVPLTWSTHAMLDIAHMLRVVTLWILSLKVTLHTFPCHHWWGHPLMCHIEPLLHWLFMGCPIHGATCAIYWGFFLHILSWRATHPTHEEPHVPCGEFISKSFLIIMLDGYIAWSAPHLKSSFTSTTLLLMERATWSTYMYYLETLHLLFWRAHLTILLLISNWSFGSHVDTTLERCTHGENNLPFLWGYHVIKPLSKGGALPSSSILRSGY
jgi:hypothetical protein